MTDEPRIEELAEERHRRNRYSRTNRPLTKGADDLGIRGEVAFAERFLGIRHDPKRRAPTAGYQITYRGYWKIKVTTSRTPGNLFVKQGKVTADVYILAGMNAAGLVYWCGWARSADVLAAPVTTPTAKGDYTVPAHTMSRGQLRPMWELAMSINAKGPDTDGWREERRRAEERERAAGRERDDDDGPRQGEFVFRE